MLLLAAIIIILIGCIHSYLGEQWILKPLLKRSDLPKALGSRKATGQILRAAWHLTTLLWFGIAAQLIIMQFYPAQSFKSFLIVMAIVFGISTAIPFIQGKGKHKSWIGFGLVTMILGVQAFVLLAI